jgi:hypothetical protein
MIANNRFTWQNRALKLFLLLAVFIYTFGKGGTSSVYADRTHYGGVHLVSASPAQIYTLTVTKTGAGNGVVISDPNGIDCGSTCSYAFNANTMVTLNGIASDDSDFTGWGGDCSGTSFCELIMTKDMSVTANFDAIPISNMLVNPSFEVDDNNDNKPDLWSTNAKFTRSNEITACDGTYVGMFRATDNSGAIIQQVVSRLFEGFDYEFSGRVKIPDTSDAFTFKFQVKWRNASNTVISTQVLNRLESV